MELAVIVLNWNAARDTIRCVDPISGWQRVRPAIFVVDNASSDNSPEAIARECPGVHLICNTTNLGFAGGTNRGIEEALAMDSRSILLLNNDASLEEEDILRLLETLAANEQIGLIGPLLFDAAHKDRLLAAGSKDPARHHYSHNHKAPGGGRIHLVECVPGTAILGKAEVFYRVGLLDERYFFSSEVADLCLRARQQGYLSAIDTQARAYHNLHRSAGFRDTLYTYYIIRNRFLLIRKFHRSWQAAFYAFWAVYSLALSLKVQWNGQTPTARAVRLGLLDGLQGRFGNQNERVLTIAAGRTDKV